MFEIEGRRLAQARGKGLLIVALAGLLWNSCGRNPFAGGDVMSLLLLALLGPTAHSGSLGQAPPAEPAGGTGSTPFSVLSINPVDNAHDTVETDPITITFSGPVRESTCDSTSIYLNDGIADVPAVVACSGSTATVTPATFLAHKQAFSVHVTTAVHSGDDVALSVPFASTFTTRNVLYMFATSSHNGNLGGRSGADGLCVSEYSAVSSLGCNTGAIRAFITVGGDDEIRDMPGKYGVLTDVPVRGPDGTLIDTSFADLLDGGISAELRHAGLSVHNFWHGSDNSGGTAPLDQHCSGWSTATYDWSHLNYGWIGADDRATDYLAGGGTQTCDKSYPILCLCSK